MTIHGRSFFEDDVDAQGDFDQWHRKLGQTCPSCGEPIADDSKACRRCAPKADNRTPAGRAQLQVKRFARLVRALERCPERKRATILAAKVWTPCR